MQMNKSINWRAVPPTLRRRLPLDWALETWKMVVLPSYRVMVLSVEKKTFVSIDFGHNLSLEESLLKTYVWMKNWEGVTTSSASKQGRTSPSGDGSNCLGIRVNNPHTPTKGDHRSFSHPRHPFLRTVLKLHNMYSSHSKIALVGCVEILRLLPRSSTSRKFSCNLIKIDFLFRCLIALRLAWIWWTNKKTQSYFVEIKHRHQ